MTLTISELAALKAYAGIVPRTTIIQRHIRGSLFKKRLLDARFAVTQLGWKVLREKETGVEGKVIYVDFVNKTKIA